MATDRPLAEKTASARPRILPELNVMIAIVSLNSHAKALNTDAFRLSGITLGFLDLADNARLHVR
tara:strand:+ start:771 stop:965 length:195 start_codon:yes stop_codon:yes gene_type:complete